MRPPRAAALVLVLVLALVPLAGVAVPADARPPVASATLRTTAVGVSLREYRIAAFRSRVLPGKVRFNLENKGEDDHDFQVSGPSGAATIRATSPEVQPGATYRLTVTLRKRGLYRLVCTLGDHEAQGMVARIRVVRKL